MKGHVQSNFKVPHPTFVSIAISVAITILIVAILNMVDTGAMGIDYAEAARRFKPQKP
ncbi:MAG TPA: hypothetical protein VFK40_14610 [Nitrososphaeraceae archaeon]|jgi:hypothetical protein|nr:hypothetical protein [Nitrososphaeraceae archaeon]